MINNNKKKPRLFGGAFFLRCELLIKMLNKIMKFTDWLGKKTHNIVENDELIRQGYRLIKSKFGKYKDQDIWWKPGFPPIPAAEAQQAAPAPAMPPQQQGPAKPKAKLLGPKQYGNKTLTTFALNVPFDNWKAAIGLEELKKLGLWQKSIGCIGQDQGQPVFGVVPGELEKLIPILSQVIDISSLSGKPVAPAPAQASQSQDQTAEPSQQDQKPQDQKKMRRFLFQDLGAIEVEDKKAKPDENGQKPKIKRQALKIMYVPGQLLDQSEKTLRKQLLYYTFPDGEWKKESGGKDAYGNTQTKLSFVVTGSYDQYVLFGILMERYGFDRTEYRKIFRAKFFDPKTGKWPDSFEGRVPEDFLQTLDSKLPKSEFKLYDAQKEGVSFLFGRRKAILGDETGLGKTVQLISAAEVKMQESGYKNGDCLIITLKAIVDQWEEEILRVIGANNEDQISTSPNDPRRYTILYYNMFSPASEKAKADTKQYVQALQNHNFQIVIFDELHKVKHKDAAKSKYLSEIIKDIPTKWGASATISSNKPMDVKNQLAMLGHPLGDINDRRFREDFAGAKRAKKTGAAGAAEKFKNQVRAAENLNKWLHLTGVYVRRKKTDIKEMPNLSVNSKEGAIDMDAYQERFQRRCAKLKKQIPITVLGAARLELAVSKVPLTVKKVSELVAAGKRVVVFTSFIESGILLKHYLQEAIKKINPDWEILTYTSDTKMRDRLEVKPKFTHDQRYRVLLMSVKMGGTGIDFPNAAQNMVVNDYDWTPESCEQSEGRIYRINTEHPVDIEYVLAQGTLDELLYEKVQRKRQLAAIIQRYRKDYQDELEPTKAAKTLEKIVQAQTEIKAIDDEVEHAAMSQVQGHADEHFGFNDFLKLFENEDEESVFDEAEGNNWFELMKKSTLL